MRISAIQTSAVLLCWVTAATLAADDRSVRICFYRDGSLSAVERRIAQDADPIESAVRLLVAGPTAEEVAAGFGTSLPAETRIVTLTSTDDEVDADLSWEVLQDLDEATLQAIYAQFRGTLVAWTAIERIRLTFAGQLLSSYLQPAPDIGIAAQPMPPNVTLSTGLAGRKIAIGPSHGRFWNGSGWYWQRSDPCGLGEAVLEDTNSIRLCRLLWQYLSQDGATVYVHRELDETVCCHGDTGLAWWKLCTQTRLHSLGLPCYVWASYSGNCGADTAVNRLNDDIRARPLYADYVGADIYISHHTNAGGGTGTETFRDTAMEHPAHEANSYALATAVNNGVVNAIREMYDAGWANRGVKDSSGGFGEIRIPNRPACLIELGFHDRCDKDAVYLTDNFFRSVAEWGLHKGVCSYFGTTPTWDRYSCEIVSDTIPATMEPGESLSVTVTMRNRGVVWSDARQFRLGAVDDSDPFTTENRSDITGEVFPGEGYAFELTLTAPAISGSYVTDWRMVRDGVTWFGPTLSRTIDVTPTHVPGDTDDDNDVDMEDFGLVQTCLTGAGFPQEDPACERARIDTDDDVDQDDLLLFLGCLTGANIEGSLDCAQAQ